MLFASYFLSSCLGIYVNNVTCEEMVWIDLNLISATRSVFASGKPRSSSFVPRRWLTRRLYWLCVKTHGVCTSWVIFLTACDF